ncbi:MAG TPA: hypothetical protein VK203_10970 [Nostocaceae cyanobacterium]|nr:hypothetical protein [Nostocaceae cyanobacterium]
MSYYNHLKQLSENTCKQAKIGSRVVYISRLDALPYYGAIGTVIFVKRYELKVLFDDINIRRAVDLFGVPKFYPGCDLKVL